MIQASYSDLPMRSTSMITKPDFFLGRIWDFPPWNLRPLDASFSNTTLKLTLEKIRLGFFRRVQRLVVLSYHCLLAAALPTVEPDAQF